MFKMRHSSIESVAWGGSSLEQGLILAGRVAKPIIFDYLSMHNGGVAARCVQDRRRPRALFRLGVPARPRCFANNVHDGVACTEYVHMSPATRLPPRVFGALSARRV
jgi:hypothetical protein